MTLVTDAVDKMIDGLRTVNYGAQWSAGSALRTTNLRFDIELPGSDAGVDKEKVLTALAAEVKVELQDLVTNGDVTGTPNDALLKAMDGELKRGAKCTKFAVNTAQLHAEYKPKKRMWEYTLFCVIYAEFGEPYYMQKPPEILDVFVPEAPVDTETPAEPVTPVTEENSTPTDPEVETRLP